jgi:hypothetical protein
MPWIRWEYGVQGHRAHIPLIRLKRCLLGFWALWLSIVFLTNVLDGAKALGVLPPSWQFASGNWLFLMETTARYATPAWLNALLFAGVIGWEGLAAVLFWRALRAYRREASQRRIYAAFTAGLTLWSAFILADEVFIAYAVEATHLRLFIAQLATLLAIQLLPDEPKPGP